MESSQSAPTSSQPSLDLFCISCGYNQRGLLTDRCPECGQSYAALPPSPTRLPWLHRGHLGRVKAYWRTAGLVIFRHREFCEQIDAPIRLRDARSFWGYSVLLGWLPLVGAVVSLYFFPADWNSSELLRDLEELLMEAFYLPIPLVVFSLIGALLFFGAASGMPSYFCHPRALPMQRQNRAIALSYFASAPLVVMPVIVGLLLLARVLWEFQPAPLILKFLAALLAVLMLGTWYWRTIRIVLTLSQRRRRKLTVMLMTLFWLFLLVLCVGVIPIGLWYVAMTTYTLFR
jgi:hypothetical protein